MRSTATRGRSPLIARAAGAGGVPSLAIPPVEEPVLTDRERTSRSRWADAGIALASILLTCAAFEVALRATDIFRPPDDPIETRHPDLYRADPHIGYTLWPSRTMLYRHPDTSEEQIPLVSNSDGFRSARELWALLRRELGAGAAQGG